LIVGSISIPYSEGSQASQTNFNYSKISFPFYKDCRIFCEGEWEQIIKRDGIAIINKNNRNNLQLLVFGIITAFGHNMAFSLITVFGLIMAFGHNKLIELIGLFGHIGFVGHINHSCLVDIFDAIGFVGQTSL
jgi:hypothetical protein